MKCIGDHSECALPRRVHTWSHPSQQEQTILTGVSGGCGQVVVVGALLALAGAVLV